MKSAKVLEAHKGRTKKCIQVQNGRWLTIYVSKKTLSCYETWFHNMRPGFKKKKNLTLRQDLTTRISSTEGSVPDSTLFLHCNTNFAYIIFVCLAGFFLFFDDLCRGLKLSPVCSATGVFPLHLLIIIYLLLNAQWYNKMFSLLL
jgi:hypothetical protein